MKKIIKFLMLFYTMLFLYDSSLADHVPEAPGKPELEYESNLRLIKKSDDFTFQAEGKARFEGEDQEFRYHSFTTGAYYRWMPNLKVGGFYRLQRGVWHDDDWIIEDGRWKWRDTNDRNEHLFIGDISPRFHLSSLPGANWIFKVKNRYLYNSFNQHQTFKIRPEISYFWLHRGDPFLNFSLQYEVYFPLNYGDDLIYEQWIYGNILYHLNNNIKLGFFGAFKRVTWGTSEDFESSSPGEDYSVEYNSFVIGFDLVILF